MATVPLSRGLVAQVDDADLPLVAGRKWHLSKGRTNRTYYAHSMGHGSHATRKGVYMHRLIMAAGPGQMVDHINGDSLDNRRANLRLCDAKQNGANRIQDRRGRSRFKGVFWEKGAWRARIGRSSDSHIGRFQDEEAAARAYDAEARQRYGSFARPNFPLMGEIGCLREDRSAA